MSGRKFSVGEIRDVMGALLAMPGMQREYGAGMHMLADALQAMDEANWRDGDDVLVHLLHEWQGHGAFARNGRKDVNPSSQVFATKSLQNGYKLHVNLSCSQ